jgi:hypothetical protein
MKCIIVIIIVLVVIIMGLLQDYHTNHLNIENFNNEAITNIASIYNTENMKISNVDVTKNLNVNGTAKLNGLSVQWENNRSGSPRTPKFYWSKGPGIYNEFTLNNLTGGGNDAWVYLSTYVFWHDQSAGNSIVQYIYFDNEVYVRYSINDNTWSERRRILRDNINNATLNNATINGGATVNGGAKINGKLILKNGEWRQNSNVQTVEEGLWGDWRGMKMCPEGKYVCGLEARFERDQGKNDDTALNGIRMTCCDF